MDFHTGKYANIFPYVLFSRGIIFFHEI